MTRKEVELTSTLTRRRLVSSCKTSVFPGFLACFCLSLVAELKKKEKKNRKKVTNESTEEHMEMSLLGKQRSCLSSPVVVSHLHIRSIGVSS